MSTCKDCIHIKVCFGPDGLKDGDLAFSCLNAEEECEVFEATPKVATGPLPPLGLQLFDSYYGKPREWRVDQIAISKISKGRRRGAFVRLAIVTKTPCHQAKVIYLNAIGKDFFINADLSLPKVPLSDEWPEV